MDEEFSNIGHVSDRVTTFSPEKEALLALRLKRKSRAAGREYVIPRRKETDVCPLSFAQQRLWFLSQLEPGSSFYNVSQAVRLTGVLKVSALEQSLNEIVRRHETLRTSFSAVAGRPVQVIAQNQSVPLPLIDLSELPGTEREAVIQQLAREESWRPFDLATGPLLRITLLRFGAEDHVVLMSVHHIVSDGWSLGVLTRELTVLYESFSRRGPSPLPELPIQYADFAVWQRDWLKDSVLEEQLSYWKRHLADLPMLQLPTDRPRSAAPTYRGARLYFAVPKAVTQKLRSLSQREGTTMFMTLLAAFQTLLSRYTGQEDIVVGTDIANRNRSELEGLIGFFINQLVMRSDLSGDPSFLELLARVRRVVLEAQAHQDLPFERLVEELRPERSLSIHPLFQVKLVFQNTPPASLELSHVALRQVSVESGRSNFDITLSLTESDEGIFGLAEYSTDLFDAVTVERMMGHYQRLLAEIARDPAQSVAALPLLSAAETQQLLYEWNDTGLKFDTFECVHEVFESQAARWPDETAVVFEGQEVSYRELNGRVNQVARYLQGLGVGPEVRVGLYLERSVELVLGVLGVLQAGGAYVPLDVKAPLERVALMMEDAGLGIVLTQTEVSGRLPASWVHVVELDGQWEEISAESEERVESGVKGENLAYVIYTSGSTGQSKGVMVRHRSLSNINSAVMESFALAPGDRQLQFLSTTFDAFVEEIYPTLCSGATLVLHRQPTTLSPSDLLQVVERYRITVLHSTPVYLHQLVEELWVNGHRLPAALRLIIFGGESLALERLAQLEQTSSPTLRLINAYGPTETTVTATTFERSQASGTARDKLHSLPIGRPIANVQVFILDKKLQPVPVGARGELHISGAGLARGYLNAAAQTAEKFIPHPFSSTPGQRLYRTGDVARYLSNGGIEFLGRLDSQVKIRGYRIDLGEVEAALLQHDKVREAVVTFSAADSQAHQNGARLRGYVVSRTNGPDGELSGNDLRHYLQQKLPEYMVPTSIQVLKQMPFTETGKVDRKLLPDVTPSPTEESYAGPRTEVEQVLCRVWIEVLGVGRVGIYDNFFELGGDSILSIQVVARANRAGLQLTTKQLFQNQTIAALAAVAGTTEIIEAEQEIVTGEVPLTPIQHWFFEHQVVDAHHYNQSVMLEVRQPLELALLREVVRCVLVHHDALRLQFNKDQSGWHQVNAGLPATLPCFGVDLSMLPLSNQGATIESAAASYQQSFNLSEGPLLRVVLFDLGQGQNQRLLIAVHHLAVDGVSWRILLEDLQQLYAQLSRGETTYLPPKTTSFRQWSKCLSAHAQSAPAREALDYWRVALGTPVGRLPVDEEKGPNSVASAEMVRASLSEDETRTLLQDVPAVYRTQINDLLLAGLVQAFADWSGQRRLLVDLEGHGREELAAELDVTRTVGWFTSYFPVVLESVEGSNIAATLKKVKEQLRSVRQQRGAEYPLLRYLASDEDVRRELRELPQAQVSFNYLGQFDQVLTEESLFLMAKESTGPGQSNQGLRTHSLEVNGRIAGGQLGLFLTYSANVHRRETMERLAHGYAEALRALIAHCRLPEAGGYTPSDFPLAKLEQRTLERLFGNNRQIEDVYPLSPMQQGMLFHCLFEPDAGVYVAQQSYRLEGDFNPEAFEQAWQRAVDRYTVLRTSFLWEDLKGPLQVVHRKVTLSLERRDWQGLTSDQQAERLRTFLEQNRGRGLDLSVAPLIRLTVIQLSAETYQLISSFHHLLADGWSWPIVLKDVFICYEAFRHGEHVELGPVRPYRDYIDWLQHQDMTKAEAFWRQELLGFTAPTPLGLDRAGERQWSGKDVYETQELHLSTETTKALKQLARKYKLTLNTLMQGAWALLLSCYSGEEDVVFGATVSGRPTALQGAETMVGMFINTLPLRVRVAPDAALLPWLKQIQERQVEIGQYEYSPLVEIQGWSEVPRGVPFFESILVFEKYPVPVTESVHKESRSLEIHDVRAAEHTHYPLSLEVADTSRVLLRLGYDRRRFDDATVGGVLKHIQQIIESMTAQPEQGLSDIQVVTDAERHKMLTEWNDTTTEYELDKCYSRLFERQADQTPDAVATSSDVEQLSYRELNERTNRIARRLVQEGVGPETVVPFLALRSVNFLTVVLALFKAGGAYLPIDPYAPANRLEQVLEQTRGRLIITTREFPPTLMQALNSLDSMARPRILFIEELLAQDGSTENLQARSAPGNLSYVIYTSGSTGLPKGAMIDHTGMLNHVYAKIAALGLSARDTVAQTASQSFDISVWQFLAVLLVGGRVHIFSDEAAHDTTRLLEEIALAGVTVFETVPSLLSAALDHEETLSANQRRKLPALRWLILTGEALPPELCRRWLNEFPHVALLNAYGPTECSDDVTHHEIAAAPAADMVRVPIGRPLANMSIYILDRRFSPVPAGIPGELCVGGVGVGRGYMNDSVRTSEVFVPNLFDGRAGARMYRTGDLARYLPDGNIEFLGRLDHQVKLHGFRIELGEIETVLGTHPGILKVAVLAIGDSPDMRLVAYIVVARDNAPGADELRNFLKERLPDYMVPATFVRLDQMPLTPSGKLNRRALPAPRQIDAVADLASVVPMNPIQEVLAGIWAEVLRLKRVGIHDNFFELGGHSLLATQIISRVREVFQVELPLRSLFEYPALADLAMRIEEARLAGQGQSSPPIKPVARDGSLPLSFAQQRLWFLDQYEPNSSFYNIPIALRLRGALQVAVLEQSFQEIIRRHEVLRTTFVSREGRPIQVILPSVQLTVPVIDLSELREPEREACARELAAAEAQRPFDLSCGPLLRVTLLRLGDTDHSLLFILHHIVSDGWSTGLFVNEFNALYAAFKAGEPSPLPELPIQYADYAVWQREWLQGEVLEDQLAYWRQQLGGSRTVLELPTDGLRPAVQSFRGAMKYFVLPAGLAESLRILSRREGATLFMTLLAAFQTLLHRYTGQTSISVGTPIAGRSRTETEPLIGFFVNTLVLRAEVAGDPNFKDLLKQVRELALGAYAHQDVPFEKLVEELEPERSLSHSPLFQVMLVFDAALQESLNGGDLEFSSFMSESTTAKFDLTLFLSESEDGSLAGTIEYNTDLFERSRIDRMIEHFQTLLNGIAADPEQRLSQLPLLTDTEEHRLLVEWNETEAEQVPHQGIHEWFASQAGLTPDRIAVVCEGRQLSYGELNARANQVAHHLRELGVGPDVLVAISMERSIEMVVGMLAILKAGGAYVPLDPAYPAERLLFMLEDTQAPVLVTQRGLIDKLPVQRARLLCLDRDWDLIAKQKTDNPASGICADNLAYVIYTSGSTGKPKGIGLSHRALMNLIEWHFSVLSKGPRTLQFASLSFDASFHEIFATWCSGGTLFIATEMERTDGMSLANLLSDSAIEKLVLPVVVLQQLAERYASQPEMFRSFRELITTGEQLQITTPIIEFFNQMEKCSVHNHYGPSESHVVTSYTLPRGTELWPSHPPIGRPIANTQIYILDPHLNAVPVGVPGELYIGGVALGRGYINRPELTAEKFIPDPFSRRPGGRLYRTGDLSHYAGDGNIEYLGRIDHQIKLRGFRIELGEIEAVLGQHPAVQENVVLAREDGPGQKRLVAYVVTGQPLDSAVTALREFLKGKLPDYMVPSTFVLLEELPLTANGKVDRSRLPEPDKTRPDLEAAFVAPRNAAEELVAAIWSEVLGVERVGVYDNFFDLGGHSLLATQVISRLRGTFQVELLPLRKLFESPTVAELVDSLAQLWGGIGVVEEIAQTARELEKLSAEELEMMLSEQSQAEDDRRQNAS
jgi:amino acid adenylation domain-containing protein/non-ribosomal peptide synthase protein (TIGR01720 family)